MPTYKRPPIIEAAIELRYNEPASKGVIEKVSRRLKSEYAFSEDENAINISFVGDQQKTEVGSAWIGRKLTSVDRADIIIFRTTAFLCARLAPYPGWDNFRERAARDWTQWHKVAGVVRLARIGVRFINRLDIPVSPGETLRTEDYLAIGPRLPDADSEPISGYTMQIARPLGQDECGLILNSGLVPSPLAAHASLTLDIDVYRESALPMRDDQIWSLIDRIRVHKNAVFEACITDRARELFQR